MGIQAAFAVPHPPLIIPAVGNGRERGIQKTIDSYREVARRIVALSPDTVVITSPHATLYRDWFHVSPGRKAVGDLNGFGAFGTRLETDYDEELTALISQRAYETGFPAGTLGERDPKLDHATYIPLWFLREAGFNGRTVRIGLSGFNPHMHYRMGQLIAECAGKLGRSWVHVASGDLSHKLLADGPYGFVPEGPKFDAEITQAMDRGDFLYFLSVDPTFADTAAECGLRSFQIMAGALDGLSVRSELLSYEGPFGVGYGVAAFDVTGEDAGRHIGEIYLQNAIDEVARKRATEDVYVKLARATVERYVLHGETPTVEDVCANPERYGLVPDAFEVDGKPSPLPADMLNRDARAFVSLHTFGQLRGCMGTVSPAPLARTIIEFAVTACSADPRFDPVEPDELDVLDMSVDVLTDPEPIDSADDLDPKRYGVIVTRGVQRGLLLPDLDGVDTAEQQISIAKRKAGIAEGAPVRLQRFEVVRHV